MAAGTSTQRRRRRALLDALGPDAVALVPAANEVVRSRDIHHPFRQSSDLTYLCGFPEPEALAVFAPRRKEGEFILFCRPRDPARELWDGPRVGVEGAQSQYGADQAHPIPEIDSVLPGLLEGRRRVYYPLGLDQTLDRRLMDWLGTVRAKARAGVRAPTELVALSTLLHEQRLFKDPAEVKTMRKAARISAAAHRLLMTLCRPGVGEWELEAAFVHACAERGGRFQAYSPIVGGGANACVLHYVDNGEHLRDGDLVLIDAGCEYQGYASDITRTFPVNGRFSPPQRELYELVLEAQQAAIRKAVPGNRWNDPHDAAVRTLTKGLVGLGILPGGRRAAARLIKAEQYKPFYMHRTGHWLGMDVHDVGEYKVSDQWRLLEPGMVLTVEPGLYIPAEAPAAEGEVAHPIPEPYRGIGIRIEDDVLITEAGNEILSADAPKSVAEIEALMATGEWRVASG
jgi:Xaa-Pro aminopeptidase